MVKPWHDVVFLIVIVELDSTISSWLLNAQATRYDGSFHALSSGLAGPPRRD